MKRKELLSYFKNKYLGNEFVLNVIDTKTTDELISAYKETIKREEKESEMLENGTVTYTIDFNYNLRKDVEKYMLDHNMFTMFDGKISYRCGNDGRLLGVPIQFIEELQKKFELKMLRKMHILGRQGIRSLQEGDKVSILMNDIFGNSIDQGTICKIDSDMVTVKKYRSRSKGYVLNVGDECSIKKIKNFQKVS